MGFVSDVKVQEQSTTALWNNESISFSHFSLLWETYILNGHIPVKGDIKEGLGAIPVVDLVIIILLTRIDKESRYLFFYSVITKTNR